jgi:hypothetical protein
VMAFGLISLLLFTFWGLRFSSENYKDVFQIYSFELIASALYFVTTGCFYFGWLRYRLKRSVQVFPEHLKITRGKFTDDLKYSDIESVNTVCWSIFYVKMKSGIKHYFNSSIERVDYIWEGIYTSRPDLLEQKSYEEYRVKLVQFDHHQKRKEWFFKHKMVDVFNWGVMPVLFIFVAYMVQTKSIVIHNEGVYFFRLFMFAMLVMLTTTFTFSILLKKFIFDQKVTDQHETPEFKVRDMEFEGMILQRSKMFQMVTAAFVLGMLIKMDVNLYSVSKVKEDIASFKLKKGNSILIDNRYNCLGCKYQLHDGDFVVFGRGIIGQVLAKEGDMVGQVAQDSKGRMIASENIQEVPRGHLAVKAANGKDIVFVKIDELIGKIQN